MRNYTHGRMPSNLIDGWLWKNARLIICNKKNTQCMRRIRAGIKKLNDPIELQKMRFMDGYDGPSRQPKSFWSIILDQGSKF